MATGGVFTQEFAHEFEAERGRWLRRRFLWYAGVVIGFSLFSTLLALPFMLMGLRGAPRIFIYSIILVAGISWIGTTLYIISFFQVSRSKPAAGAILRRVFWLIVISGLLNVVGGVLSKELNRADAKQAFTAAREAREEVDRVADALGVDAEDAIDEGIANISDPQLKTAIVNYQNARVQLRSYLGNFSETHGVRALTTGVGGAAGIFITHFFACLFLPWSPRESIRPMIPLFFITAIHTAIYGIGEWGSVLLSIALLPLVALPGLLICWMRISRFRDRFSHRMLRNRYSEVRKELIDARRIHESLFPKSIADGPVRFNYHYEPMRQIGGDFLYARTTTIPGRILPVLDISIIDVTGHGISAALTVNRLFGELERQYAEHPAIAPGRLLTGLNNYIHNTLASHSVYATALCIRIDPNDDSLTWASAGHPPAFVRTVDGKLHQLDSTTFVLGACHGNDFAPHPETMHFGQGDVMIAYTDGAIEARSATGAMLRVEGMMGMIHSCRSTEGGSVGHALVEALNQFRYGNALDDTLFVEVYRPVTARTSSDASETPSAVSSR